MHELLPDPDTMDGWVSASDSTELFHPERDLRVRVDSEDTSRLRVTEQISADGYRTTITRLSCSVEDSSEVRKHCLGLESDIDLQGLTLLEPDDATGMYDMICVEASDMEAIDTDTAQALAKHGYGETDALQQLPNADSIDDAITDTLSVHLVTVTEEELTELD